ncbi:MAG: ABC transporter substrate-binding protein [Armatimonadota bacterium]
MNRSGRARGEIGMVAGFVAAVLGVSLLLLALFALWGRLTAHAPDPGAQRILFTGWGGIIERKVFTDLVAEFERRHPEIDVEYRPVPRDYVAKLKVMVAGGAPPDVFYVPDGDFAGFALGGKLLNLEPFVARSEVVNPEEIWEAGLRRYRFDGRVFGQGPLYALPKDIGPTAMYVNRDLLRAQGIPLPPADRPLTWDEAEALWRSASRDTDGDGRIDQWGTHGFVMEAAIWSNGGRLLSADGRRWVLPDDPRAIEALEWLVSLQAEKGLSPMERQRQSIPVDTLFLTGRLATFIGGRWMVPMFRNAEFDWDVVPVPVSPRTRRKEGWSGSVGLAISPGSAHKEAAWKLVEFLVGPEGQAAQTRTGFQVPNQKSLARTEVFLQPGQRPESAEVFIDAAEYQQSGVPTRTPDHEWWDLFIREIGAAYRGEKSVKEVLRSSRAEIQTALDRSWSARR